MHRTASFDVLSVKIGLTDSPVGEFKSQKSAVNFEQEGCIFHLYREQKPLGGLSCHSNLVTIGSRVLRWLRVKFCLFPYTLKVVLTTLTLSFEV